VPNTNPSSDEFTVEVVSSASDQVSGGDARLHIAVPRTVPLHQAEVWVNGVDQRSHFVVMPGTRMLTGVIDGLIVGDNTVMVKANGKGKGRPSPVSIALKNHPITGPIFSGPHQYPFVCTTMTQGLGQPIPDDPDTGTKTFDAGGNLAGYSRNCSAPTQVTFRYRTTGGSWATYTPGMPRPADMAQTTTTAGKTVDFIVRWERGTINRFIYSIAMLAPFDDGPETLGREAWNGNVWRGRDRALPGQPEHLGRAVRLPARTRLRSAVFLGHTDVDSLQPPTRRRNRTDGQGAVHRTL